MTNDWKPILNQNTLLIENGEFIILNQKEFGYQLKLKKNFKYFLSLMDGSRTIVQLQSEYQNYFGRAISFEALDIFIKERLLKSGFIVGDEKVKARNSQSFIKARITILKKEVLEKLYTRHINFIFKKRVFYILLFFLFSINFIMFLTQRNILISTKSWLVFLILFMCHIFHEVGHAMAAKAKQSTPGNIGFGFYFILPVFFVDLSDTWNIRKQDRIIINLSGVLFDYIVALVFGIIFYITNDHLFVIVQIILFTKTFYNLNPLIRTDAYWVVSDFLDMPNLNDNATLEIRRFFGKLFSYKTVKDWKLNLPLLIYGITTTCFWIFIIYNILIQSKTFVSDISELFIALKQALFYNKWDISIILSKSFQILFISFAFYILFRLLLKWAIILYQKTKLSWKRV